MTLLTMVAAFAAAGGLIFGVVRISMWMTDKKTELGSDDWSNSAPGADYGYGTFDNAGSGGDSGGGGD